MNTRTAAALASRRSSAQAALGRVHDAISRLRREKTPVSVAAVSRRAGVSRTFLYDNGDASITVFLAAATSSALTPMPRSCASGPTSWKSALPMSPVRWTTGCAATRSSCADTPTPTTSPASPCTATTWTRTLDESRTR